MSLHPPRGRVRPSSLTNGFKQWFDIARQRIEQAFCDVHGGADRSSVREAHAARDRVHAQIAIGLENHSITAETSRYY